MVDASALYDEMEQAGVERDIMTCRSVMMVHFKQSDPDAAVQIFREFQAAGHAADNTTYHAVCQGLNNCGRYEQTVELFGEMAAAGLDYNVDTCNILMVAYCETGRAGDAIELFKQMGSRGLEPDVATYHMVAKLIGPDTAPDLVEAVEAGRQKAIDQRSVMELVVAYCRYNQFDALDMLPMEAVVADKAAARRIMQAFALRQDADKAAVLFDRLSAEGAVGADEYFSVMIAHGDSHPDQVDRYFTRGLGAGHFARNRIRQTPKHAVVDLHGLTATAAIAAVKTAFHEYRKVMNAMGDVLVITGRGRGSDGGVPVLRPTVVQWLDDHGMQYRFHKGSGHGAVQVDAGSVVTWAAADADRKRLADGAAILGVE